VAVLLGLLLVAVQQARAANRLRQVALAMHPFDGASRPLFLLRRLLRGRLTDCRPGRAPGRRGRR
jgi:hypothetical protein